MGCRMLLNNRELMVECGCIIVFDVCGHHTVGIDRDCPEIGSQIKSCASDDRLKFEDIVMNQHYKTLVLRGFKKLQCIEQTGQCELF